MITIKMVYVCDIESEGVFNDKDELLDAWSGNDANWRDEYLNQFMKKLGIQVVRSYDNKLQKKVWKALGC